MDEKLKELFIKNFNEKIFKIENIPGGWLTDKWRIISKNYDVMIKVIALKKIERRNIKIENVTNLLNLAYKNGIRCSRIYHINDQLVNYDKNNSPIIFTEYIKNTFCKTNENINLVDMYNIANEVGKINALFKTIKTEEKIDGKKFLMTMKEEYKIRVNKGKKQKNTRYLKDVYKQRKIINSLKPDFFDKLTQGYCHCDLSQDNILFDNNGFKAIIDFEIANNSYILRDPARVFLTFALNENGEVNKEMLQELIRGYNNYEKLTLKNVIQGIKILWCLEVNLWIKETYYVDEKPEKVKKFINEINWITENWFNLDEIIKKI